MSNYYSEQQINAIGSVVGDRIANATKPSALKFGYESNADTNVFTDAEKTKLAALEEPLFRGDFGATSQFPNDGASGQYLYLDAGSGSDTVKYIWDSTDSKWISVGSPQSDETPVSIKQKYESNNNTNAYTDAEKQKLASLNAATDISAFTAALDAAIAASGVEEEVGEN